MDSTGPEAFAVREERREAARNLRLRLDAAIGPAEAAWQSAGQQGAKEVVLRRIVELGGALASLDAAFFTATLQNVADAWLYLALRAISSCSALAGRAGLGSRTGSSSDLLRWARCGSLIVTCGRAQLRYWVDAAAGSIELTLPSEDFADAVARPARNHAGQQLTSMWWLLRLLPEAEHAQQAFAASIASEDDLMGWLATVAATLSIAESAGCLTNHDLASFADIVAKITCSTAFGRHCAALAAAPQQQAPLAALLPALCRAAALDASGNGRSDVPASLMLVPTTLDLLKTGCLKQGLLAQLQGSRGAEMLAAIAALVNSISRQPPVATAAAAYERYQLLFSALGAWATICTITRLQLTAGAPVQPAHRRVAQQAVLLLPALARMVGQLQQVDPQLQLGPAFLRGIADACHLINQVGKPAGGGTAEDWALPVICSRREGVMQAAQAVSCLAASAPARAAQSLGSCVSSMCVVAPFKARHLPAGHVERQELLCQLRGLHATACRLAHHLPGGRQDAASQTAWSGVLYSLANVFTLCVYMYRLLEGAKACTDVLHRQMTACAAAHRLAVGVALTRSMTGDGKLPILDSTTTVATARSMYECLELCSPWPARVRSLLPLAAAARAMMLAAQGEDRGGHPSPPDVQKLRSLTVSLASAAERDAPRLAASLISTGLLQEVVQGCLGTEPGEEAQAGDHDSYLKHIGVLHSVLCAMPSALLKAAVPETARFAALLKDLRRAGEAELPANSSAARTAVQTAFEQRMLPAAKRVAATLETHWQQTDQQAAAALELAQAAATRGCANLRCANLGAQGGPDRNQPPGTKRCAACLAVRYCCVACQAVDWRVGRHCTVCPALAAARADGKAARAAERLRLAAPASG